MKTGNWLAVLFFISVSVAIWVMTASFPPSDDPNIPGAAFFPRLVAIIMVVLTVMMAVENVRKNNNCKLFDLASPGLKRNGWLFIISTVYCVLLNYIGFLILTPFALFIMMLVLSRQGLFGWKIFSSVVATVSIYLVFEVLLDVPLPTWSF
jgi:putative tricarboxylic transport membrane protein